LLFVDLSFAAFKTVAMLALEVVVFLVVLCAFVLAAYTMSTISFFPVDNSVTGKALPKALLVRVPAANVLGKNLPKSLVIHLSTFR
jgi:hypothetical protein